MSKILTDTQLAEVAKELGVEYAAIKAVAMVESRGAGFLPTGEPTILFESAVFRRQLAKAGVPIPTERRYQNVVKVNPAPYGTRAAQHGRLQLACEIDRDCALMSASWGKFQVMGFNYYMSYESLQDFINAAYHSERDHLDMFLGYVKYNNLVRHLKNKAWTAFAVGYNGKDQRGYDLKMAREYAIACKKGPQT